MNQQLNSFMRQTGATESVRLSLSDNFVKLELPKHAKLTLSSNLANMLGFDQLTFQGATHLGSILPATLDKREQEIFIYLDIVDLMHFGNEKRQMIQHFVHNNDAAFGIVERFFDPIIYQPVTKNMIESLTIQFITAQQQLLSIKDSKSIVTLHFRKTTL